MGTDASGSTTPTHVPTSVLPSSLPTVPEDERVRHHYSGICRVLPKFEESVLESPHAGGDYGRSITRSANGVGGLIGVVVIEPI
jgi:hypothetical protein